MRASISKSTPFIYLAFEKTDPFIYLIIQNVDLFIYCPMIFEPGYYTNIKVNSCNTKRISSLEKSLSEKYVHIPGCQKNGAFHTGIQKNRAIHTIHILFVEKRGPIIYLAALKKGAIRHAHPYYAIYRLAPGTRQGGFSRRFSLFVCRLFRFVNLPHLFFLRCLRKAIFLIVRSVGVGSKIMKLEVRGHVVGSHELRSPSSFCMPQISVHFQILK